MELVLASAETRTSVLLAISDWRDELDAYYAEMKKFESMELDEILMKLAGFSSRFSYIRSLTVRSVRKEATAFRTTEIDPFITECDRQFKIWSRVLSVKMQDWAMERGTT